MMLINKDLLDELSERAKASPKLRMNYDLRNSSDDLSQRQLNALEPGTFIPVHRHKKTSETVIVLRGKIEWKHYNNDGEITDSFVLQAGTDNIGISSPAGQWHSLECLESGTVIMEAKDGEWKPLADDEVISLKN